MHHRIVAYAFVLMITLSGCSQESANEGAAPPASDALAQAPITGPLKTTDQPDLPTAEVLYLDLVPGTTLSPPEGSMPFEAAMPATGPATTYTPRQELEWSYTVVAPARLSQATALVWIRVTEPIVTQPEDSILRAWVLSVELDGVSYATGSAPFGPSIMPGDYVLNGTIDLVSTVRLEPGSTVTLSVATGAIAPMSQRVLVLGGSSDYPSHFRLAGLREPIVNA